MAQLSSVLGSDRLPKPWRMGICSHCCCAPVLLLLLLLLDLVVLPRALHSVANCSTRATVLAAAATKYHIAVRLTAVAVFRQASGYCILAAPLPPTVRLATTAPSHSIDEPPSWRHRATLASPVTLQGASPARPRSSGSTRVLPTMQRE